MTRAARKNGAARPPFAAVTETFLLLMVTLFPLFPGFKGYTQISEAKFVLFCVLCGGYAAVMLLLGLEGLLLGVVKPRSPLNMLKSSTWPQRLVLLYVLLSWVSALASPYFPQTVLGVSRWEGALTITLYGLCFLLVSVNPLGLYPAGLSWFDAGTRYTGEYLGTIGNTDLLAAFLCLVIPVFWVALLRLRDRRRFLLLLPLALALFVLLRMRVLAGFVGVFLGGLIALPAVLPASKRTRRLLALGLALLLLLGLAALFFLDPGAGLLHELHELLRGHWDPAFGSGRLHIWSEVLRRVPERLLLGAGPDTMLLAELEPFTRLDEATGRTLVARIDVAHNEYLNVLYHQGLPALLCYLALLALLARCRLREARERPLAAMLGSAALCYALQAFFGFSTCIVSPLFWLALALPEATDNG